MTMLYDKFRRAIRAFIPSRTGNVAATFALAIIPIIGFVGAAIDYSRANSTRTAMQAALDTTALMLSKDAATLNNTQLNAKALDFFKAVFTRPEAKNILVTASYSTDGGSSVKVDGSATIGTNFVGLLGFNTLDIKATSTTAWGTSKLRVALVLDNSGSMADNNKMSSLKTAAKNLVTMLQNAATTPGDVQVAIVPFTNDVNVGTGNVSANWLDWTDWNSDNTTRSCVDYDWRGNCERYAYVTKPRSNWNGCVTDRTQNYDTRNTTPATTNTATLFPADQSSYCPVPLMALGYNWSSLNSKIDSMIANGATNQQIGLAWGWQLLSQGQPFPAPALPVGFTTNHVIILLSDGLNTQNRWYGNGTTYQSRIDDRQEILCDNIKAAGIEIYAIQVNTSGDPTQPVMQHCASGSDKFFLLTSGNQIVTTFNAIGTNLAKLRVAK